jgi:hypothetical protein
MIRKLSDDAEPSLDVDETRDEMLSRANPVQVTEAEWASESQRPQWRLQPSQAPWDLTFRISRDLSQL